MNKKMITYVLGILLITEGALLLLLFIIRKMLFLFS